MAGDSEADAAGTNTADSSRIEAHADGDESDERSGADDESPQPKSSKKDPTRPRRRKARRACFACQRAHLTCGDERPCLRCIKRGLQDQCHDGVRKKAKYLHDAPSEALVPGMGGSYQAHSSAPVQSDSRQDNESLSPMAQSMGSYYPARNTSSGYMNIAQKGSADAQASADTSIKAFNATDRQDFADPSGISSNGQSGNNLQNGQSFEMPFDPTDPHFFNFDISGLNFGNHYGAHEFAMLGHMSSAFDSPSDNTLLNSQNFDTSNTFGSANNNFGYGVENTNYQKWPGQQNLGRQSSASFSLSHADAGFTIGESNGSIASASPGSFDVTGHVSSPASMSHKSQRRSQADVSVAYGKTAPSKPIVSSTKDATRKRRDPSSIYKSITEPYSYTTGFHSFKAFIVRRFSKERTLRIAKALASIRPSFISCTRDLSRDDLIFMEQGFQRNLLLYDDYINAYGCPTLICRRTGEVALASKEFALLSGWRRDVLLGKEPNLNVNHGTNASVNATGNASGASSHGNATPSGQGRGTEAGKPQPVFLAEVLDDETACQFYDDFAKMAFGDSRGQVTRRGKILKYKTKDDPGWSRGFSDDPGADTDVPMKYGNSLQVSQGIDGLGDKDGKVDVMVCHTVKRDTFDIPMMIIINFLPVIP